MSKRNRRKEMEAQKASKEKVIVEETEEKKEAEKVVKAVEKKVQEPKEEPKTLADAETIAPKQPSSESGNETGGANDGPGQAYRYWDGKTRTYGLSTNIWAAKQISNGVYDIIWVWYRNGQVDHILSIEEIKKYAPR